MCKNHGLAGRDLKGHVVQNVYVRSRIAKDHPFATEFWSEWHGQGELGWAALLGVTGEKRPHGLDVTGLLDRRGHRMRDVFQRIP